MWIWISNNFQTFRKSCAPFFKKEIDSLTSVLTLNHPAKCIAMGHTHNSVEYQRSPPRAGRGMLHLGAHAPLLAKGAADESRGKSEAYNISLSFQFWNCSCPGQRTNQWTFSPRHELWRKEHQWMVWYVTTKVGKTVNVGKKIYTLSRQIRQCRTFFLSFTYIILYLKNLEKTSREMSTLSTRHTLKWE